jgi:hypothetical protein
MTEADDDVVELGELDRLFEDVLAGRTPGPDAPAWCGDLSRLVRGARADATPAELSRQDDVVTRMIELRLEAVDAASAPGTGGAGGVAVIAPSEDLPTDTADDRAGVGDDVGDDIPAAPRLVPAGPGPDPYLPRHARSDQPYRAKHAAPRTPLSSAPTARDVGRLIAVKAAAVTTAVVVGTVAAAAATTGIVANVVVPVFSDDSPKVVPGSETPATHDAPSGGQGADGDDGVDVTVPVPECQLTPVCSPLSPLSPSSDPVPSRPTGPTVPTTERPRSSTTTTESPATTSTTDTTSTTEPDTTPSTTETTTTTVPDPVTPLSLPDGSTP